MSTRAIVRVKAFNKNVDFYHHHNGFIVGGLGEYLIEKIKKAEKGQNINGFIIKQDVNDFVEDLMLATYKVGYEEEQKEFKITFYNHTDVEYLYIIEYTNKDKFILECFTISYKKIDNEFKDKEISFRKYEEVADNWLNDLTKYEKYLIKYTIEDMEKMIKEKKIRK